MRTIGKIAGEKTSYRIMKTDDPNNPYTLYYEYRCERRYGYSSRARVIICKYEDLASCLNRIILEEEM